MPFTLTITEGVLPRENLAPAVAQITAAFLQHHGLGANPLMAANVTAHVNVMAEGTTFAGGEPVSGAWIEWKVPSFALADREIQKTFSRRPRKLFTIYPAANYPRAAFGATLCTPWTAAGI
ncbi:MAG: hypothetical protein JWM78_2142 [Verrucomicrobiaceae bacterium]|nr:hypothetical protein [Verrucomicrobiaceae bacterium]